MGYKEESIKVWVDGERYWFLQNPDGSGPIAPLDHCEEDGTFNMFTAFSSDTFAHVGTDRIMRRYGRELGTVESFLTEPNASTSAASAPKSK